MPNVSEEDTIEHVQECNKGDKKLNLNDGRGKKCGKIVQIYGKNKKKRSIDNTGEKQNISEEQKKREDSRRRQKLREHRKRQTLEKKNTRKRNKRTKRQ